MNPGVPSEYLTCSSLFNLSDENPGLTFDVRFPVLLFYCLWSNVDSLQATVEMCNTWCTDSDM